MTQPTEPTCDERYDAEAEHNAKHAELARCHEYGAPQAVSQFFAPDGAINPTAFNDQVIDLMFCAANGGTGNMALTICSCSCTVDCACYEERTGCDDPDKCHTTMTGWNYVAMALAAQRSLGLPYFPVYGLDPQSMDDSAGMDGKLIVFDKFQQAENFPGDEKERRRRGAYVLKTVAQVLADETVIGDLDAALIASIAQGLIDESLENFTGGVDAAAVQEIILQFNAVQNVLTEASLLAAVTAQIAGVKSISLNGATLVITKLDGTVQNLALPTNTIDVKLSNIDLSNISTGLVSLVLSDNTVLPMNLAPFLDDSVTTTFQMLGRDNDGITRNTTGLIYPNVLLGAFTLPFAATLQSINISAQRAPATDETWSVGTIGTAHVRTSIGGNVLPAFQKQSANTGFLSPTVFPAGTQLTMDVNNASANEVQSSAGVSVTVRFKKV